MLLKATGWLRRKWRPMLIHGSIIAAFVACCLFVSDPLFDRLEVVAGESNRLSIKLPSETDNLRQNLHEVRGGTYVAEIRGWAFIDGHTCDNDRVCIVLESDERTYVFDTMTEVREDVTSAYGGEGLNLDHSGLICNIPSRAVKAGDYIVGVYVEDGDARAFQRTHIHLVKSATGLAFIS
ncbi:MAG: hypothetical protein QUS33_03550 [Dehalococcoidia bacterium]|nr:hypothetical protein [Dehalococcoidia bacterium]